MLLQRLAAPHLGLLLKSDFRMPVTAFILRFGVIMCLYVVFAGPERGERPDRRKGGPGPAWPPRPC